MILVGDFRNLDFRKLLQSLLHWRWHIVGTPFFVEGLNPHVLWLLSPFGFQVPCGQGPNCVFPGTLCMQFG